MRKLLQLLRDNASPQRQPLALVRAEGADEATLYLYDVIDASWGVSAREVAMAMSGLSASTTLHLRINSPGGDVFEARAIAAHISQRQGRTVAHIDGLAASAATTIACAAAEVEISPGSFYMIHNAWTFAIGNRFHMMDTANLLEKVDGAIVADYARRTGAGDEQIGAWMAAETWFTAEEAVTHKFADRLAPTAAQTRANTDRQFNLAAYDNAPKALTSAAGDPSAPVLAANRRRLRLLSVD